MAATTATTTVTCVLSQAFPFDAVRFATEISSATGESPTCILERWERLAEIGTTVHAMLEEYHRPVEVTLDSHTMFAITTNAALERCPYPFVSYYEKCLQRTIDYLSSLRHSRVICVERHITIELDGIELRGRIDAIVSYSDKKTSDLEPKYLVVDWKTGKDGCAERTERNRMQTRMYAYMYSVACKVPIERMRCVIVNVEGKERPRIFLPQMTEAKMIELVRGDAV